MFVVWLYISYAGRRRLHSLLSGPIELQARLPTCAVILLALMVHNSVQGRIFHFLGRLSHKRQSDGFKGGAEGEI